MIKKILIYALLLVPILVSAEDSFADLLSSYEEESELSKVTRKDSAGFLDVYTRHDLEQMQAHTLLDVLKTVPGINLTRSKNNNQVFAPPTKASSSLNSARLYINDHDMSSSSFGSAFLIWGDMPIEYIDHIEFYKGTSAIEFSNEIAILVVKLYTKTAEREEGGKIRTMFDQRGSYDTSTYFAQELDEDTSYFAYINSVNIQNKQYHNDYLGKEYDLDSDSNINNLYMNFRHKNWIIELGNYTKEIDSFLGIGTHKTPSGGNLDARHSYVHITKSFDNDVKLQLSYDDLEYDRTYIDENGIRVANVAHTIDNYNIFFQDKILSTILEKEYNTDEHHLVMGAFYKKKGFEEKGKYSDTATSYYHTNSFTNSLNLYSIYTEENYFLNDTTTFVASVKGDFYRYDKDVKSADEYVARFGVIKNIDKFQVKLFYIDTYMPLSFFQLYNTENMPYKTNPNLSSPQIDLFRASIKYKTESSEIEFTYGHKDIENGITYNYTTSWGYENLDYSTSYDLYQIKYKYTMDKSNKIYLDIYTGDNSLDIEASPQYGINLRIFNSYKKFDFYNELLYKSSYTYYDIYMKNSYDFTSSIKYHYNKDLLFGLRAENILDDGYEQSYKGLDYSIPITDRKIWLNMEFLF